MAIGALEHLIRVGAMFVIPCRPIRHPHLLKGKRAKTILTAYYYENYPSGIGIVNKAV